MGDHFYTTNAAERDNAAANLGYRNEGVACYVLPTQTAGTVDLFRLWGNGDHFYTTNAGERDNAVAHYGYHNEGTACYVYPDVSAGGVPFFRMWGNGDHFYTTDAAERDQAVGFGYASEGVACNVQSSEATGTVPLYRLFWVGARTGDPFTVDTGDQTVGSPNTSLGAGEHMQSAASMNSQGLITGHTHIWCTKDFAGFHGSVTAFILDADQKVLWPPDPEVTKHRYGVDGADMPGATSDRTVPWSFQVDAGVLPEAKALALQQFLDPNDHSLATILAQAKPLIEVVGEIIKLVGS